MLYGLVGALIRCRVIPEPDCPECRGIMAQRLDSVGFKSTPDRGVKYRASLMWRPDQNIGVRSTKKRRKKAHWQEIRVCPWGVRAQGHVSGSWTWEDLASIMRSHNGHSDELSSQLLHGRFQKWLFGNANKQEELMIALHAFECPECIRSINKYASSSLLERLEENVQHLNRQSSNPKKGPRRNHETHHSH